MSWGIYLNSQFDSLGGSQCKTCRKTGKRFTHQNNIQPVWFNDNGDVQWHVPEELKGLRIGEQMLIQRYSPYVPLVHIKNGTFGCTGHVCCFPQELGEVCHVFPRLPSDVKVVKMVRHYVGCDGDDQTQVYKVRKDKVLAALYWLKKHHKEYANDEDLVIDEGNLDWMKGKNEVDLKGVIDLEATTSDELKMDSNMTVGVSEEQTSLMRETNDVENFDVSGVVENTAHVVTNDNDEEIVQAMKDASRQNKQERMNWPQTSRVAIDEYRNNVFVNTFPWLYPGGIGDVNDQHSEHHVEESQWARIQLRYYDGRFQKDPMWCFYALNYVQRHRNKKSGGFFLKDFVTNKPATLRDLITKLENGDTTFIEQLQYFSGKLEGSDAYWRKMKAELYSWISHHIEVGNGPPNLFMTLSCAEYFWPDVQRLINQRSELGCSNGTYQQQNVQEYVEAFWPFSFTCLKPYIILSYQTKHISYADNKKANGSNNEKKAWVRAVNDHALLVQEHFQQRVISFLESYGRHVLGIKHYWVRYEFAKGRGQIHAHLLAITDDASMAYARDDESPQERCQRVESWVSKHFGMTATHPATDCNGYLNMSMVGRPEGSLKVGTTPMSSRTIDKPNCHQDLIDLCNCTQMHKCSSYCMREPKKKRKRKTDKSTVNNRYCRFGCGSESKSDSCNTPGFPLNQESRIVRDQRGFLKLELKRNTRRMLQTSFNVLQPWRANCDLQIMLYDSTSDNFDYGEMARVTDYVVSYSCKGNQTLQIERDNIKTVIMK